MLQLYKGTLPPPAKTAPHPRVLLQFTTEGYAPHTRASRPPYRRRRRRRLGMVFGALPLPPSRLRPRLSLCLQLAVVAVCLSAAK